MPQSPHRSVFEATFQILRITKHSKNTVLFGLANILRTSICFLFIRHTWWFFFAVLIQLEGEGGSSTLSGWLATPSNDTKFLHPRVWCVTLSFGLGRCWGLFLVFFVFVQGRLQCGWRYRFLHKKREPLSGTVECWCPGDDTQTGGLQRQSCQCHIVGSGSKNLVLSPFLIMGWTFLQPRPLLLPGKFMRLSVSLCPLKDSSTFQRPLLRPILWGIDLLHSHYTKIPNRWNKLVRRVIVCSNHLHLAGPFCHAALFVRQAKTYFHTAKQNQNKQNKYY